MNIETTNRLVQHRKSRGLSQEALADSLGLSRQAVSTWERAEASPDTDNLLALARLYGVPLDELLGNLPTAQPQPVPQPAAEAFAPAATQPASAPTLDEAIEQTVEAQLLEAVREDKETSHRLSPSARRLLGGLCAVGFVVFSILYGLLCLFFPNLTDLYAIFCTILYLAGGMLFDWWHPGWMVFLAVPIFHTLFGG